MITRTTAWLALLGAVAFSWPAVAHEVRPALLEIREAGPERYDILWKVPVRGQAAAPLDVVLPADCVDTLPRRAVTDGVARITRWSVVCDGSLLGRAIRIDGLESMLLEAIVRFERHNGGVQTARLMAGADSLEVAGPSSVLGVAAVYLPLGVEHILFGIDHLFFVLALLLLIDRLRPLIWAITAFTAAHSITLAAATLGYVHVPSGPVEALIALSIVLVAAEAVHKWRGLDEESNRKPWLIAFVFGLLHGFGFAGALAETGLPEDAIPAALLFFNVGVELGQLLFVAAALALRLAWTTSVGLIPRGARITVAYGLGVVAAYWFTDRTLAIIAGS